eukprot:235667-Rhodomonas_salina.1
MLLHLRYAECGTDLAYAATALPSGQRFALLPRLRSGAPIRYLRYWPTLCPVLASRRPVPGMFYVSTGTHIASARRCPVLAHAICPTELAYASEAGEGGGVGAKGGVKDRVSSIGLHYEIKLKEPRSQYSLFQELWFLVSDFAAVVLSTAASSTGLAYGRMQLRTEIAYARSE